MTVAEILGKLTKRLDDATTSGLPASDNVYYTSAEAYAALNEAQAQFALLTLCLETSGTLSLSANTCFYSIREALAGYLVPLRVSVAGARILPASISDLEARYHTWPATAGTPKRYMQMGLDLFAIVPQPTGIDWATVVYAKEPPVLTTGGDTPEIPQEYHLSLAKYAAYYLLLKRGGQYAKLAAAEWNEFLADASQCADYVRRRNRSRQYDTLPFEHRLPVKKEGALSNA